jgi:CheY-like chemotaxis protein
MSPKLIKVVMLVEDNPSDENMTLRLFERYKLGNEVVVAHDGAEAIEMLFGRDAVSPAVVLLDLNLPRGSGIEVLRRIRATESTRLLPVVVLTSSSLDEDLVSSYGLGPNTYVRKPVDFNAFVEAMRLLGLIWFVFDVRTLPS